MAIRYDVRVAQKDGTVVVKRRFKHKDKAFNFAQDKMRKQRSVRVKGVRVPDQPKRRIISASEWGRSSHGPYQYASGPLKQLYLHTSVTKHLPESATIEEEKAQMRSLDAIAKGRGFNGISYSFVIFPSGRIYEGRGWLVVEAATEGYNSSSDSICFGGNTDAFKPSAAALQSAEWLINAGQNDRKLTNTVDLVGHRKVAAKACPGKYVTDTMIEAMQRRVAA